MRIRLDINASRAARHGFHRRGFCSEVDRDLGIFLRGHWHLLALERHKERARASLRRTRASRFHRILQALAEEFELAIRWHTCIAVLPISKHRAAVHSEHERIANPEDWDENDRSETKHPDSHEYRVDREDRHVVEACIELKLRDVTHVRDKSHKHEDRLGDRHEHGCVGLEELH